MVAILYPRLQWVKILIFLNLCEPTNKKWNDDLNVWVSKCIEDLTEYLPGIRSGWGFNGLVDWNKIKTENLFPFTVNQSDRVLKKSSSTRKMLKEIESGPISFRVILMHQHLCTVANWLKQRSGPTYVGPDLCSSLFASRTIFFLKAPKIDTFNWMQTTFSWQPFCILAYNGLKIKWMLGSKQRKGFHYIHDKYKSL